LILETNTPKRLKEKMAKKKEGPGESKEVPAGTTAASLARAMWIAQSADKSKTPAEQRKEDWKKDAPEYKKLARRVIARLSRRGGENKTRDKSAEAEPKA
jgi:hypothetical protein